MHFVRFFIVLFLTTFYAESAFSSNFDISVGVDKDDKEIYYNEKKDCNDENKCREEKNYAKIGAETYSQKSIWRKLYFGIDINWHAQRFDDENSKKYTIYDRDFWSRFENLNVYIGYRAHKFFGFDLGYSYFGNVTSKEYDGLLYRKKLGNYKMHGIFIDAIAYTPAIHIHTYTSVEGYASVGGVVFFSDLNNNKGIWGAKFGAGIMVQIYGPFAINAGVDYYFPLKTFSNNGMLTVKTGFNFFLNI